MTGLRASSWLGLLFIFGGGLYLLSELHVVPLHAHLWQFSVWWPLLLVAVGVSGHRHRGRWRISWWSLGLAVYGVLLFLHNTGWVARLQSVSMSAVFWALVLICVGLSAFLPRGRRRLPFVRIRVGDHEHVVDIGDAFSNGSSWKPRGDGLRHWIGDISLGSQPWVLEDTTTWNGIGDVRLNLATAHMEDRTYHLHVEGWIGDIRVLVPNTLPVQVNAEVGLGDVTVFEDAESGTGRRLTHEDARFADAKRRVVLNLRLKIGDIEVVRV